MSKFWLKTMTIGYNILSFFSKNILPFIIGYYLFRIMNPENFVSGIIFFFVWILICFITIILYIILKNQLRNKFSSINNFIKEIKDYDSELDKKFNK